MSRKSRRESIVGLIVSRVGWKKAIHVMGFLFAWAGFMDRFGRSPTADQVTSELDGSRAKFFRDLALFRQAFPGEKDPERLAQLLLDRGVSNEVELLDLEAPAWLVSA